MMVTSSLPHLHLKAADALVCRERLLSPGDAIVVAVSGGPDSMALLEYLAGLRHEQSLRLVVAHVLHGFRPADAEREASFVRRQAARHCLPCVIEEVDTPALIQERKLSPQAAARTLRYEALRRVQRSSNAEKLAVGHTADDQAETVLFHFLRGAGPQGLSAMRPVGKDGLIRPLLAERRAAIVAYLQQRGVSYLEDPSNSSHAYVRNRIRHHLLPLLEQDYQANIREHLLELARISRADAEYLDRQSLEIGQRLLQRQTPTSFELSVRELQSLPPAILDRVILWCFRQLAHAESSCSAAHVRAVRHLVQAPPNGRSRRCDLAGRITVWRAYERLRWQRRESGAADSAACSSGKTLTIPGAVSLSGGVVHAELVDLKERPWSRFDANHAWIDRACVRGDLRLRTRRSGDRLQALGMQGTKSLKDLFIDWKVPIYERQKVPLIVDDDNVIWVVGHRMHHAYRLTPDTRQVLHIWLTISSISGSSEAAALEGRGWNLLQG